MLNRNRMVHSVVVMLSILLISCYTQGNIGKGQEKESIGAMNNPIDYLALGDSYTIGEGVEELERWPNQLSRRLSETGVHVAQTRIVAQTGWTTRDLLNAIERTDLSDLSDDKLVSLLIGVNNQYQKLDIGSFKLEFDLLLNRSIQFAGNVDRVFVVSIPDYGVTPFGSSNAVQIGKELDEYNDYMSSKCAALLVPFIDITKTSRELSSSPNALASDNLHPSGFQYGKWLDQILPVVRALVLE